MSENTPNCEKCDVALKKTRAARGTGMQLLCFGIFFAGMYAFGMYGPIVGLIIMALAVPVGYGKCWKCPSCKAKLEVN